MSFEPEFLELMKDTIKVRRKAGTDVWGRASIGLTIEKHRARVVHHPKVVESGNETVTSRVHAWVAGNPDIKPGDEVTLPDGSRPPLLAVSKFPDETGNIHHEVLNFA